MIFFFKKYKFHCFNTNSIFLVYITLKIKKTNQMFLSFIHLYQFIYKHCLNQHTFLIALSKRMEFTQVINHYINHTNHWYGREFSHNLKKKSWILKECFRSPSQRLQNPSLVWVWQFESTVFNSKMLRKTSALSMTLHLGGNFYAS